MSQTPSERFTEREEAAHAMQERIEAERRYGTAVAMYPHLEGSREAAEELAKKLKEDDLRWHEEEIRKLREGS